MYCSTCGARNDEVANFCRACGGSLKPETSGDPLPHVPNHLVWAILVTIFCCLPFGIVSIVYAAQVNSFVADGRFDSARQASDSAKMWAWIAFAVGLVSFGGFGFWTLGGILPGN